MDYLLAVWNFLGRNAAEIIALCALAFTGYQSLSTRRHNILSVRPHLTMSIDRNHNPASGRITLTLTNNGLGPAHIRNYQFYVDGNPITADVRKTAESVIKEILGERKYTYQLATLGDDYALPANESRDILTLQFTITGQNDFEQVERKLDRLGLSLEYESIYKERFSYDSRTNN